MIEMLQPLSTMRTCSSVQTFNSLFNLFILHIIFLLSTGTPFQLC